MRLTRLSQDTDFFIWWPKPRRNGRSALIIGTRPLARDDFSRRRQRLHQLPASPVQSPLLIGCWAVNLWWHRVDNAAPHLQFNDSIKHFHLLSRCDLFFFFLCLFDFPESSVLTPLEDAVGQTARTRYCRDISQPPQTLPLFVLKFSDDANCSALGLNMPSNKKKHGLCRSAAGQHSTLPAPFEIVWKLYTAGLTEGEANGQDIAGKPHYSEMISTQDTVRCLKSLPSNDKTAARGFLCFWTKRIKRHSVWVETTRSKHTRPAVVIMWSLAGVGKHFKTHF